MVVFQSRDTLALMEESISVTETDRERVKTSKEASFALTAFQERSLMPKSLWNVLVCPCS